MPLKVLEFVSRQGVWPLLNAFAFKCAGTANIICPYHFGFLRFNLTCIFLRKS